MRKSWIWIALRGLGLLLLLTTALFLTYLQLDAFDLTAWTERGEAIRSARLPYLVWGLGIALGLLLLGVLRPERSVLDVLPALAVGAAAYLVGSASPLWLGVLRSNGWANTPLERFPPLPMAMLAVLLITGVQALLSRQPWRFHGDRAAALAGCVLAAYLLSVASSVYMIISTNGWVTFDQVYAITWNGQVQPIYLAEEMAKPETLHRNSLWLQLGLNLLAGACMLPLLCRERIGGVLLAVGGALGVFCGYTLGVDRFWGWLVQWGQVSPAVSAIQRSLYASVSHTPPTLCLYLAFLLGGLYAALPEWDKGKLLRRFKQAAPAQGREKEPGL